MTSTWQAHVLQVSRLSFDHFLKHIHVLCHSFSKIYIHIYTFPHSHSHTVHDDNTNYNDDDNTDWLIIMITMITIIIIKIKIISSSTTHHHTVAQCFAEPWRIPGVRYCSNWPTSWSGRLNGLRELEAQRLVDLSVSWNHGRAWPGWPVFCGSFFLGGKSGMAVDLKTRWVFDTIWRFFLKCAISAYGGLEHGFYFSIGWECHQPNWLSYFSEGLKPPTSLVASNVFLFQFLKG